MIKIYKKYKLENDMCNELIDYAKKYNWVAYPEQGGWDILLIRNSIQVGIQAKLRPTIKLISQAIVPENYPGPHYRAIAIGNTHWGEKTDIIKITEPLKIVFIDMGLHPDYWLHYIRGKSLRYFRHFPAEPLWVPPFVPKLPAGVPSPKTVSPWKISAVKLEMRATEKGWVSIKDAREIVNQEVPEKSMGSYPQTLLKTYFTCTGNRDPDNPRCKKWVLRKRNIPSKLCPEIFDELKQK